MSSFASFDRTPSTPQFHADIYDENGIEIGSDQWHTNLLMAVNNRSSSGEAGDVSLTDLALAGSAEIPLQPLGDDHREDFYFSSDSRQLINPADPLNFDSLTPSGRLLKHYLLSEGFGDHHIEVYDSWLKNSARLNVMGKVLTFPDRSVVYFENLHIKRPLRNENGIDLPLLPKLARERGLTYGSEWSVDMVRRQGGIEGPVMERVNSVYIGLVPMMLKSRSCHLHGCTPEQLATLGEDPSDPGGYFIVSGAEKVVLLREILTSNKIFLMDKKSKGGRVVCRMTVNSARGSTLIELILDKSKTLIKMNFPNMKKPKLNEEEIRKVKDRDNNKRKKNCAINVLRVFRLFKVDTAEKIQQLLATFIRPEHFPRCMLKLSSNLMDFVTDSDDVGIIMNKMEKSGLTPEQQELEIDNIMERDLFPHLNDMQGYDGETVEEKKERIDTSKINLLAIMLARFLEHLAGYRSLDDRDSWSNKRVEGAGRQMEILFRAAWRKCTNILQGVIDYNSVLTLAGVAEKFPSTTITSTFHDSFNTSSWGVKNDARPKNNVAQTLSRDSVIATFAHINTVDVEISRTDRVQDIRLVQMSQWGFIDSVSTPEGDNCFLVGTLVLRGDGSSVPIEEVKDGDLMLTLDPRTLRSSVTSVSRCFRRTSGGQPLLRLTTVNGKSVVATSDHLFLTQLGFVRLDELDPSIHKICTAPVPRSFPFIATTEVVLEESSFAERLSVVSSRIVNSVRLELTSRKFFPLSGNDSRLPTIARLLGFVMADSRILIEKSELTLLLYFPSEEDAQEFTTDSFSLGFPASHRRGTINLLPSPRNSFRREYVGAFPALMIALGASDTSLAVPSWILRSCSLVKREFLAGLMGGAGGTAHRSSSGNFTIDPFLAITSPKELASGHKYLSSIGELFTSLSVKTSGIHTNNYSNATYLLLAFLPGLDNVRSFMDNVGYRYHRLANCRAHLLSEYPSEIRFRKWRETVLRRNETLFLPIQEVTSLSQVSDVADYTTVSSNHTIICANGIVSNNCGILKNLALTAKVSVERSDNEIIRFILGDEGKGLPRHIYSMPSEFVPDSQLKHPSKLMVNGKFLGWCHGLKLRQLLLSKRREGSIVPDMSVIYEEDWLYVDISPSRLLRPLLVVDENQNLLLDILNLRDKSIAEMIRGGAMEYISSWEQEYLQIAPTTEAITERLRKIDIYAESYRAAQVQLASLLSGDLSEGISEKEARSRVESAHEDYLTVSRTTPFTHCEIDPLAILGVAAALIPWANHNQAPRNTYQVSMGKQALGIYHANHLNRMTDVKAKILAFPARPLVETELYDVLNLDSRGPGENITVAFMAYPFTEEDSCVFKKEFLDNGGFRIYKYLTYKAVIKRGGGDMQEYLDKPAKERIGERKGVYDYIQNEGRDSPVTGLPMIGAPLRSGDCVIGKTQEMTNPQEKKHASVALRIGDEGIVDRVLVTSDKKTTIVTVKLRVMRIPQEGDKFAPRNAQKCTIGLVMRGADMPFNEDGLVPDMIVNPHCIPSRMTMSYLMELQSAKTAAYLGVHVNSSPFRPFNMNDNRAALQKYGKDEFGYENLRSGLTGEKLETPIYMGPCFIQALKHHVIDKIQYRGTGYVKSINRQPPKGRGQGGGLRFGEMERDAGISHGATSYLRERLMFASDAYQTVFCHRCGSLAVDDNFMKMYKCRLCGDNATFGRCTIPFAYKLLIQLLAVIGINLRPKFLNSQEYRDYLFTNNEVSPVNGEQQLLEIEESIKMQEEEEIEEGFEDAGFDDMFDDI